MSPANADPRRAQGEMSFKQHFLFFYPEEWDADERNFRMKSIEFKNFWELERTQELNENFCDLKTLFAWLPFS